MSKLIQKYEKLIIRPHPSESIDDWYKITKDFNNVLVLRDGDITPWILAAMQLMLAFETLGLSTCSINWPDIEIAEKKWENSWNYRLTSV